MSAPSPVERSTAHAGAGLRLLRAAVFAAVCVVLSALGHVAASCVPIPWWTLVTAFLLIFAVATPLAGRERSLPGIAVALAGGQLGLHTLFALGQRQLAGSTAPDDVLIRTAARILCGAGASSLSASDAHGVLRRAGIDPAGVVAAAGGTTGSGTAGFGHSAVSAHVGHAQTAAASPDLLPAVPMLLGHLLAALAVGWLLRRGEMALFRLARPAQQVAHGATGLAEGALVRSLRAALVLVRALVAGLPGAPGAGDPGSVRTPGDASAPPEAETLQHTVIRRGPPVPYALAV
jgi:hypothetical protein